MVPLTILVGSNGAGKSNFLDALRFTSQALRFSLDHALRERGGINEVRRRSRGHPNHFGIRLDFQLPESSGWYAFEVGAKPQARYIVRKEWPSQRIGIGRALSRREKPSIRSTLRVCGPDIWLQTVAGEDTSQLLNLKR